MWRVCPRYWRYVGRVFVQDGDYSFDLNFPGIQITLVVGQGAQLQELRDPVTGESLLDARIIFIGPTEWIAEENCGLH